MVPERLCWCTKATVRHLQQAWQLGLASPAERESRGLHAKGATLLTASQSPTPAPQYLLTVRSGSSALPSEERRDTGPSYISLSGLTTRDCRDAATYIITQGAQLMSGGESLSTTGLVSNAPFAPASKVAAISTTFSVIDGVLHWNNTAFVGNQALFCQTGSTVDAVFDGQLPNDCAPVTLGAVLVSPSLCPSYGVSLSVTGNMSTSASTGAASITVSTSASSSSTSPTGGSSYPGSLSVNGVVADLIGGYAYGPPATVLFGPHESVGSLEQCLTFCVAYMYFGVSGGMC